MLTFAELRTALAGLVAVEARFHELVDPQASLSEATLAVVKAHSAAFDHVALELGQLTVKIEPLEDRLAVTEKQVAGLLDILEKRAAMVGTIIVPDKAADDRFPGSVTYVDTLTPPAEYRSLDVDPAPSAPAPTGGEGAAAGGEASTS